jgi:c-di-GMP phosphodiesterase Gmr
MAGLPSHMHPAHSGGGTERKLLDSERKSPTASFRPEERAVDQAVRLLNSVINLLPVGITLEAEDGTTVLTNEMATLLAGDLTGDFKSPGNVDNIDQGTARSSSAVAMEEKLVGGGERTLLQCRSQIQMFGRPYFLTASLDFTERKRFEVELLNRAYYDILTGLPNRALVQQHVDDLIKQPGSRFALAFLDIDNFKHINDYYTHATGDALLVKVAERICAHLRPTDVVARISGDEFLLVLNPIADEQSLKFIIEGLLGELKAPFLIEGFEILTSASVGVSIHPDHGNSYEALRRSADTAMYQVKERVKGGAALFDAEMARALTARMAQEQRLRLAIRDRRFCCAFQPKVDIRTQEVVGVEALIRLRDEDGVLHAPSEFIGLAIDLGLIDDLSYLALREIVQSIGLLDDAFGPTIPISVNISAKQASDSSFMSGFCDELRATSYADRFVIEVTEEAFLATSNFQKITLPMLREIGARVSVDDFGTGYSSLATLADITADEIKIDRTFIKDIHLRPRSQSVLKAIDALSEALDMVVIAEGVEKPEEVFYLQSATMIRFAQGFYFSKPIFLEELRPSRRAAGIMRSNRPARDMSPTRKMPASKR